VTQELERYRSELAAERQRQAAIKQKYGVRSLQHLIVSLDGEIIELQGRLEAGEKVELPLRNKREQKENYQRALAELEQTIERECALTLSTPRFVAAIRVVPAPGQHEGMAEDPQTEQIGMRIAITHERACGRQPQDVADQNLGYDIRSTDPATGHVRFIEVKARARRGPVALTRNEWFKANRFGNDYFLYVVLDAASQPTLRIIQNPARNLTPREEPVEVRYVVPLDDILTSSHEARSP